MKKWLIFIIFLSFSFSLFSDLAKYVPSFTNVYVEMKNPGSLFKYIGEKDSKFLDEIKGLKIDTSDSISYFLLSPSSYGVIAHLVNNSLPQGILLEEKYKNLKIYHLKKSLKRLNYAVRFKNLVFLTSDISTSQRIIETIKGSTKLSEKKEYKKALEENGKGLLFAFFNLKSIINSFSPFLSLLTSGNSQKGLNELFQLMQKENVKRIKEKLQELDFSFFNINLKKDGIFYKNVIYFKKKQLIPMEKLTYFSLIPEESFFAMDILTKMDNEKGIIDFYRKIEEKSQSLSEENKKKLKEMKERTLGFQKKIKDSIYPEICMSLILSDEKLPYVLFAGKVKDKKVLEGIIGSPQKVFPDFLSSSRKWKIQNIPDSEYLSERIKGLKIKIPEREQEIKLFYTIGKEIFLVSIGNDEKGIKKGIEVIKGKENNLENLPEVLSLFKPFPKKVSAKFYLSPSIVLSKIKPVPISRKGLCGVMYSKEEKIIVEGEWDKKSFSSLFSEFSK